MGTEPDAYGHWTISLEPYPEANIGQYELTIAEYSGRRPGECALPMQYGGSSNAYRLWPRAVRPFREGSVQDAIILIKDTDNRYHARVIRREQVGDVPAFMQSTLSQFSECGQLIEVRKNYEWIDFPWQPSENRDTPFAVTKQIEDTAELVKRIQRMSGAHGRETVGARHRRSRRLAEYLKRLYGFKCQLCDGSIPRIYMGGDRYYVEVHHVKGLAEVDKHSKDSGPTQEASNLALDTASNIVVVCPHHHMVLHHTHGGFRLLRAEGCFLGADGTRLTLVTNEHL